MLEDGVMIVGPAIIGRNCQIRHNAYIRQNVIIGDDCVVGNATEVKNSILFNHAQAPHFNYVGDSILGFKAHLGAGVKISNFKVFPGNVTVEMDGAAVRHRAAEVRRAAGRPLRSRLQRRPESGQHLGRGVGRLSERTWRGTLPARMIVKNKAAQEIASAARASS